MAEGKAAHTDARRRVLGKSWLSNSERANSFNPPAQPPKHAFPSIGGRDHTDVILSKTQESPTCPSCGSQRIWKDGLRYPRGDGDPVQRWLCRDCGYRFSETSQSSFVGQRKKFIVGQTLGREFNGSGTSEGHQRIHTNSLKRQLLTLERRVCVSEREAKNLAEVESRTEKRAAGATKPDAETIKGIIAKFAYWLEKEGYYEDSGYLHLIRTLAKRGANLLNPEDVKSKIAKQPWKNGTKNLAVYAYDALTKMLGISWTPPKYVQEERLPWIPEEKELDTLIGACRSRRMAAFLQTLKETFADPGEVLKLRWIDINASNNTITINHPVKGHNPRQLQVSNRLIAMLNALPKTSERVFPTTYSSMDMCFIRLKRRAAQNLQNPRLQSISFTTFRHWGATMTYHYTRKILLVQKLLGHKNIKNTLKYTQLVQFKDDEFDVETATTVEEAKELLKVGFDYITDKNGIMLFRRPKRFGSLGVTTEN